MILTDVRKDHMKQMRLLASCLSVALAGFLGCPALAQNQDQKVVLQTTKGPIVLRVFYSMVPYTAGNFLDLVGKGFYDGLTFHRIESWCVQGGDPNGDGTGNYVDPATGQPRYINLEINRNLAHGIPGVLAMARGNNRNSASCQFYITKSVMRQLDGNYAVFGKVIDGMNTVYALRQGDRIISATVAGGGGGGGEQASSPEPQQDSGGYQGGPPPRSVDSGF